MKYIDEKLVKDLIEKSGFSIEQVENLDKFIQESQNEKLEESEYFKEQDELHKEASWLIYKYNQLLQDDEIKDKNDVRDWFHGMTNSLIMKGIPAFSFLYCEVIFPAESLKEMYHISDEDDKKYREKYSNLFWFDEMKKIYGTN